MTEHEKELRAISLCQHQSHLFYLNPNVGDIFQRLFRIPISLFLQIKSCVTEPNYLKSWFKTVITGIGNANIIPTKVT